MALTQIQKLQLNKQVDKILNAPGNYQGGNLEMTMVFDFAMDKVQLKEEASQIISALKAHSPVFRNVRFNGVRWKSDEDITNQVIPMTFVQMGRFFEEANEWEEAQNHRKHLEVLLQNLKLYHARSKLILILTKGEYQVSDKEAAKSAFNPFLKRKILFLEPDSMKTGIQAFLEL